MASLDRDQARALRVLRYWFGDVAVLAVLEGGSGGGSPPLASHQLALPVEAPPAQVDPPVRPGSRPARRPTN